MDPNKIFTPRASVVNNEMYVHRRDLEKVFRQYLKINKHIVMYGESGTGKSWLYKKILTDNKYKYYTVNMANVSRLGSIDAAINDVAMRMIGVSKSGYTEEKKAAVDAVFASGELSHQGKYEIINVCQPFVMTRERRQHV
jgi:hypothetical protein